MGVLERKFFDLEGRVLKRLGIRFWVLYSGVYVSFIICCYVVVVKVCRFRVLYGGSYSDCYYSIRWELFIMFIVYMGKLRYREEK